MRNERRDDTRGHDPARTMPPRLKPPPAGRSRRGCPSRRRRTSPWAGAPAAIHRGAVLRGRRSPHVIHHTAASAAQRGRRRTPAIVTRWPACARRASQAHAATSNRPCATGPSTVRSPRVAARTARPAPAGLADCRRPGRGRRTQRETAASGPTAAPDRRSRGAPTAWRSTAVRLESPRRSRRKFDPFAPQGEVRRHRGDAAAEVRASQPPAPDHHELRRALARRPPREILVHWRAADSSCGRGRRRSECRSRDCPAAARGPRAGPRRWSPSRRRAGRGVRRYCP